MDLGIIWVGVEFHRLGYVIPTLISQGRSDSFKLITAVEMIAQIVGERNQSRALIIIHFIPNEESKV